MQHSLSYLYAVAADTSCVSLVLQSTWPAVDDILRSEQINDFPCRFGMSQRSFESMVTLVNTSPEFESIMTT